MMGLSFITTALHQQDTMMPKTHILNGQYSMLTRRERASVSHSAV
jgi:hypothetical protein